MAWDGTYTAVTGQMCTAGIWNTNLNNNLNYLYAQYPTQAVMWHENCKMGAGVTTLSHVINTGQRYNGYSYLTGAGGVSHNGDVFSQTCLLLAGTYAFAVYGVTYSTCGKIDWTLDGVSIVAGQDWYSASITPNVLKVNTGITVTGNGAHTLQGTINGKNGSGGGYDMYLTRYVLYVP